MIKNDKKARKEKYTYEVRKTTKLALHTYIYENKKN